MLQMCASLHDLAVRLRSSFLREDGRQSGTIPRFLLPTCLRSGGFELDPHEIAQCYDLFAGSDGRFNWVLFCNDIESARSVAWSRLKRVPFEGTFRGMQSQDTRGYVHRQELAQKTAQWKCA